MSGQNGHLRVRKKEFSFTTSVDWVEGKVGNLKAPGKPDVDFSSPPEFKGIPGMWTPEEMFVGAIEMCQLLTFLALAKKNGVTIRLYESKATGKLEFIDGYYRFTEVLITPRIVASGVPSANVVSSVVEDAHRRCLVANSVTTKIEVRPEISLEEVTEAARES